MRRTSRTLVKSLAVTGASVLALTALSMPSANAATCQLTIKSLGSNQYKVTVGCNDLFVDSFTLMGEDPIYDDTLGSYTGFTATVSGDVLDEDWPDGDEVFANANAHDLDGKTIQVRSNTVSGSY
jgi:hypothetical protein